MSAADIAFWIWLSPLYVAATAVMALLIWATAFFTKEREWGSAIQLYAIWAVLWFVGGLIVIDSLNGWS